MRNARDNSTAPVLDNLFCLVTKHLTRQPQITFVFGGEADADFQLLQFLKRDPGFRHGFRAVRITGDGFREALFINLLGNARALEMPFEEGQVSWPEISYTCASIIAESVEKRTLEGIEELLSADPAVTGSHFGV